MGELLEFETQEDITGLHKELTNLTDDINLKHFPKSLCIFPNRR